MLWSILQVSLIFFIAFILFGMIWEILVANNKGYISHTRQLSNFVLNYVVKIYNKLKIFLKNKLQFKIFGKAKIIENNKTCSDPDESKNASDPRFNDPVFEAAGENHNENREQNFFIPNIDHNIDPNPEEEAPRKFNKRQAAKKKNLTAPCSNFNKVISIHLMANRGHQFSGAALKLALKSVNMHYGTMKIFHYHEYPSGTGKILFSLASLIEPGYFDFQMMDTKFVPGISLFARCAPENNLSYRFELMLKIAKQLATRLSGELFDDDHMLLNIESVSKIRKYIEHLTTEERVLNCEY